MIENLIRLTLYPSRRCAEASDFHFMAPFGMGTLSIPSANVPLDFTVAGEASSVLNQLQCEQSGSQKCISSSCLSVILSAQDRD